MKFTRRDAIKGASASLVTLSLGSLATGCGDDAEGPRGCEPSDHPVPTDLPTYSHDGAPGPESMFSHGVVSGDPLADRVILWTRVSPGTTDPVDVWWEVALDPAFARRVLTGTFETDSERDHTVKVDATGLRPGVTYYYRFAAAGRFSPVGRTRTAPEGSVDRLRFAVMSCSSYAHGYFHAYENVAARADLDAVIHLGDYVYEYANGEYGNLRTYDPPHECVTLDDYRRRYRHYRSDAKLQAVHRQHPFICVWDDHEVANDSYDGGAQNHSPDTEGTFADRLAAARRAYLEHMPIREEVAGSIYRRFAFGDLVDLLMLDTRNEARSRQTVAPETDSEERTLLGAAQESWLEDAMAASTSRWVVLGQQVMMAQFTLDAVTHAPVNRDQWDGYGFARSRMHDAIEAHAPGRTVVLTGDIHSSWAADIVRDPWDTQAYDAQTGRGSIAVEFVTPGVTSPGLGGGTSDEDPFGEVVLQACPHMRYGNFTRRGYVVLDVRRDKVQADFFHLASVADPEGTVETSAASVAVMHGEPFVVTMDRPERDRASCEPAP